MRQVDSETGCAVALRASLGRVEMSGQLDGLKARIQALRAKTIENGCTESEALAAAAKVAELLDRYDLSLSDIEIRAAPCEQRAFETKRKKRVPLDGCVGAIAL